VNAFINSRNLLLPVYTVYFEAQQSPDTNPLPNDVLLTGEGSREGGGQKFGEGEGEGKCI